MLVKFLISPLPWMVLSIGMWLVCFITLLSVQLDESELDKGWVFSGLSIVVALSGLWSLTRWIDNHHKNLLRKSQAANAVSKRRGGNGHTIGDESNSGNLAVFDWFDPHSSILSSDHKSFKPQSPQHQNIIQSIENHPTMSVFTVARVRDMYEGWIIRGILFPSIIGLIISLFFVIYTNGRKWHVGYTTIGFTSTSVPVMGILLYLLFLYCVKQLIKCTVGSTISPSTSGSDYVATSGKTKKKKGRS